MINRKTPYQRLYAHRLTVIALITGILGFSLIVIAKGAAGKPEWVWLDFLAPGEVGGTLLVAGLFGLALDYFTSSIKEEADREVAREEQEKFIPLYVDSVIKALAASPDQLERVASDELLDDLITNALGLRLKDPEFAREIYTELRDQVVHAPERWRDVQISIRLSSIDERNTYDVPRFDVIVQWEYTVVPSHRVQRFASVSDRDEYHELVSDIPATATWFITPRPGFDAADKGAFELLRYSVNGDEKRIRRAARRSGQTYSVDIGEEIYRAGEPVRVSYLYKTITPQSGHRLFFGLDQPTRGFELELDYSNTDISHLSVTDMVAGAEKPRVSSLPKEVDAKVLQVEVDHWLLAKTGFAFAWTLKSEEHQVEDAVAVAEGEQPASTAA